MPNFSEFIDFSSLFVALGGLLFATWHPVFQDLLSRPRPPLYRNRKAYITALASSIVSKALPLTIFLAAYVFSLLGVALDVTSHSELSLRPQSIDPTATLFMLTYWLALFLLSLASSALVRLVSAWVQAGKDRGSEPRLTWLR